MTGHTKMFAVPVSLATVDWVGLLGLRSSDYNSPDLRLEITILGFSRFRRPY